MPADIPVITVDGPSGSGKGTLCQLLATKLGFHLLDSGALYRLTAVAGLQQGIDLHNEALAAQVASELDVSFSVGAAEQGVVVLLGGVDVTRDIRQEQAGMGASIVAAHKQVRSSLLQRQRAFQQLPGLVADGRDMGTTVFPDASVKVFLVASAEERAHRRHQQLLQRGESANLRALLSDIEERDKRDTERSASPLLPASDALVIDSTQLSITEVLDKVLAVVEKNLDIS